MKTLIVGQLPGIEDALSVLYAEHGIEVGRLGSLREVLAQPTLEPIAVIAALSSTEDVALLPALVARNVHVLLIADVVTPELRIRALEQGVADIFFPPVTAAQVGAALGALRGEAPARIARHAAGFPMQLSAREGAAPIDGDVVNVSSAGFEAELGLSAVEPGAVFRVTLVPPAQAPIQAYCRVLKTAGLATGGLRFSARFVALTAEESAAIVDLVDTLPPWPEQLAVILETIDSLDVAVLRQVAVGQSTPVRLPAFTALEEEALSAGWGTDSSDDGGVGEAAVARITGALLADVLEKNPDMPGQARVAHAVHALQKAHERMRAMANGAPPDRLPMVRDLQKRVASVLERVQTLAGQRAARPGKIKLQGVANTPLENALEKLPKGPARWAILAGVPAAVLVVFAILVKVLFFPFDEARSVVAADPKMTVMGIRVMNISKTGDMAVVVVDGSWFTANEEARSSAAKISAVSIEGETLLEVRDVRGRPLARVNGTDVVLLPLPGPRDRPPSS